jgi:RimJ/RimL family protein N-acetyltransferase
MEYKKYIRKTIRDYKKNGIILSIRDSDDLKGHLVIANYYAEPCGQMIMMWREANQIGFANRFEGTIEKTKYWFENVLLPNDEKILFFVHLPSGMVIGHLGYASFDFEKKTAEIDNVVRGVKSIGHGMMALAMKTLIAWGKETLLLEDIYLKVLDDNPHAIKFYERLDFRIQSYIPLYRIEHDGMIEWVPLEEHEERKPDKHFIVMKLCQ